MQSIEENCNLCGGIVYYSPRLKKVVCSRISCQASEKSILSRSTLEGYRCSS